MGRLAVGRLAAGGLATGVFAVGCELVDVGRLVWIGSKFENGERGGVAIGYTDPVPREMPLVVSRFIGAPLAPERYESHPRSRSGRRTDWRYLK